MKDELSAIEKKVGRNYDSPPLHLWDPALSGDIDIRIDSAGRWFHQGDEIHREAIVRVFASILRREADGEYYLVTPAEKWRIKVDALPLLVCDIDYLDDDSARPTLQATLNTDKKVLIGPDHPLYLEASYDNVAAVRLDHGLSALFTRNAWYRLVELSEPVDGLASIASAGEAYALEA